MLFAPPGSRSIFSTFWGDFLTIAYTVNLEKKDKHFIHWRKFKKKVQRRRRPEITDFQEKASAEIRGEFSKQSPG